MGTKTITVSAFCAVCGDDLSRTGMAYYYNLDEANMMICNRICLDKIRMADLNGEYPV